MHNNQYHPSSRSSRRGGAGAATSGERRLGALEAVALGIVFIVGVSFGMYLEGRQHHDELQSFASPKSVALLNSQQAPGRGCEAVVAQATAERDETWKALVEQLQKENEGLTREAAGMLFPHQVPDDCKDRLGPKLHKGLYAPSQQEEGGVASTRARASDPIMPEQREAAAAADCSVADAEVGVRLKALQEETGYHVLASLELEPVLDTFLSHMVPFEREEMKKKALLVGNKVEDKRNQAIVAEAIPFDDSLKCKSLSVVMTGSDGGTCTLLVPMDRVTVSSTIYRHEQFEEGGEIGWHPVGKAPKETFLAVQSSHRSTAEKALMTLFQHLPEIESQVKAILQEMLPTEDKDKGKKESRPHVKVMILNSGNVPMFLNMVCSGRQAGLDFSKDLLVFAADAGVEGTLKTLGYKTYRHDAFGDFSPAEHKAYGDGQFLHMMWLKTVAGWIVNRLDYDLLYLDSDLIYRKDTAELFANQEVDIFMQDDGARSERFAPYFGNTGFFYVRANSKTKHLMQMMLYSYELVLAWRTHQAVFTYLMEDIYLRNLLNVKIIPLSVLPSGKIYHHRKEMMKEMVDGKRDYYVFHMNWALHNQDKIRYYKELGWWYIDDRCNVGSEPLPAEFGSVESCCVEPKRVVWPPPPEKKEERKE